MQMQNSDMGEAIAILSYRGNSSRWTFKAQIGSDEGECGKVDLVSVRHK